MAHYFIINSTALSFFKFDIGRADLTALFSYKKRTRHLLVNSFVTKSYLQNCIRRKLPISRLVMNAQLLQFALINLVSSPFQLLGLLLSV